MSVALVAAAMLGGQGIADNNRPDRCIFDMQRGAIGLTYNIGEIPIAAGETAQIRPQWSPSPSSFYGVPHRCLDGWRVSDRTLAMLSRDRRSLTIAASAPEGATLTLSARYRGTTIQQRFRVIRPNVSPIVGLWQQRESDCPGDTRLFELVFNRDGRFAVSFGLHFHGGVDYRGRWRVDGERLILSEISAERMSPLPADIAQEATFALNGERRLTFGRNWYGTSNGRGTCRAAFAPMQ